MSLSAIPTQVILQTGNGQNFLTWNIVAGVTNYSVQRSIDGVNFSAIATTSATLGAARGGFESEAAMTCVKQHSKVSNYMRNF